MTPDRPIDDLVHRLAPQLGEPLGPAGPPAGATATLPGPDSPAARALRAAIVAEQPPVLRARHVRATDRDAGAPRARRTSRARRGTLVGAGVAAAVAAAVVAASALGPSSAPTGPAPVSADALAITTEAGLVVARVSDPTADPARYAAEFAEHGLDVELTLVPASPSAVGTVVHLNQNATGTGTDDRAVEAIDAPGECQPAGGGACPVGIRIPRGYANRVDVVFGRAAAPGEPYETSNDPSAPGEALEGLDLTGRRVAEARDLLAERGQEATEYRALAPGSAETVAVDAEEVPGDWYVHWVALWAPGEVLLAVGPDEEPARPESPVPTQPPTPAPPGDAPVPTEPR